MLGDILHFPFIAMNQEDICHQAAQNGNNNPDCQHDGKQILQQIIPESHRRHHAGIGISRSKGKITGQSRDTTIQNG